MQSIIMETSLNTYIEKVNQANVNGFNIIAGSNYVKSVKGNINMSTGEELSDVGIIASIAIGNHNKEINITSDDISEFKKEVSFLLINHHVVVGTLYISDVKFDVYKKCNRNVLTFYCCCMHKN